ncbi:beta-N-acetylhexosaminidase [Rickettsia endosymbiont of Pantilius tunicatus]|uniref:beta-N-acetylhexosaminidase n=1 Tax=Rickettsia endosymbiont of Pantilius tunicatus TaxID=3066267 RepID=UPI00376ED1AC
MTLRKAVKPVIIGISNIRLTDDERKLLKDHSPLGIILFARNIEKNDKGEQNKEVLAQLITDIKEILGKNSIIAIDQEGGRVQRLTKPTFYDAPPAKDFGDLAKDQGLEIAIEKCKQNYSNIGKELKALGINLDFAPVGDISHKGAHDVIGNRSFGVEPEIVVPLCIAALEGLQQENVQGCIKHLPGHGRAKADSHKELPKVSTSLEELKKTDFKVFRELSSFDQVKLAMTAHIVYECIDPNNPATLSTKVIDYIRDKIGYKGLIISDAIDMKALSGSMADITTNVLNAGVDIVLECTGKYENMLEVLGNVQEVLIDKFTDLL